MDTERIKLYAALFKVLCPDPIVLMLKTENGMELANLYNEKLIQILS